MGADYESLAFPACERLMATIFQGRSAIVYAARAKAFLLTGVVALGVLSCALANVASGAVDLQQPPLSPIPNPPKLEPLLIDQQGRRISNPSEWKQQRAKLKELWMDFLGAFPRTKAALCPEFLEKEDIGAFTRQHVRYQIEEGVFTDGYLLRPANMRGKLPAIVVFHPTIKTHTAQVSGIDRSVYEKMQGVHLVLRGYIVLCPRCFIFDDGGDFEDNARRVRRRHPDWTGMTRMTYDGVRAVDFLESLEEVDSERVGCIGHSLGAKEALYAAAFDERYKVTVFSEGGIGLTSSNWEAVWYLGPRIREPGFSLENHQLMALIAPRAFLLLAGDSADGDTSWTFVQSVLPVYRMLDAPDRVGWFNHAEGHHYPIRAQAIAEEFIDKQLKRVVR